MQAEEKLKVRTARLNSELTKLTAANVSSVRQIRHDAANALLGVLSMLRKRVSAAKRDVQALSTAATGMRTAMAADFTAVGDLLQRLAAAQARERQERHQHSARLDAALGAAEKVAASKAEELAAYQQLHLSYARRMEKKVKDVEAQGTRAQQQLKAAAAAEAERLEARLVAAQREAQKHATEATKAQTEAAIWEAVLLKMDSDDEPSFRIATKRRRSDAISDEHDAGGTSEGEAQRRLQLLPPSLRRRSAGTASESRMAALLHEWESIQAEASQLLASTAPASMNE